MIPEAQRLHAALVSAFPAYVTRRFAAAGYPLDRPSVEAIEAATTQLDLDLASELERPFVEQRRTPLEVFEDATGTLSAVLRAAGVDPPEGGRSADPYDLAPGSSAVLGEAVQKAHTVWGNAKAAAFATGNLRGPQRPIVVVLTMDRVVRQQLCSAAEDAGYHCVGARNPSAVAGAIAADHVKVGLVDLAHRASRETLKQLHDAGVRTIVFGSAIDDLTETGLLASGVGAVVDREALLKAPEEHLPRIV